MVIIKVGTNVLADDKGNLDEGTMDHLVEQLVDLKNAGEEIVLVTSGAVSAGRQVLIPKKPLNRVERRQLWAAVGQPRLLQTYIRLFQKHGIEVAQILATKEDFRDRKHYLHMRNCFRALLGERVIPVVNENDVIAVDELMFTDNDELASLVASMLSAKALYILTNVDGVYDGNPLDKESRVIPIISVDESHSIHFGNNSTSSFGRGGMATKYRMSRRLASLGIDVYIANGKSKDVIRKIHRGESPGTHFKRQQQQSSLKMWITYQQESVTGSVVINDGAKEALTNPERASSLLPVGIKEIRQNFNKGDLIHILDENDNPIGLGRAQYGSETLEKCKGQHGHRALVHYDYLVITNGRNN